MGSTNGERAKDATETYAEKARAEPDPKGTHNMRCLALPAAQHCVG